MAVLKANDEDLRTFIFDNKSVIVAYIKKDCAYCDVLKPLYKDYSADPRYSSISFLEVDSGENPVAFREVGRKDMPFMSIYKEGLLVECESVRTEVGLRRLLEKLLVFERHHVL